MRDWLPTIIATGTLGVVWFFIRRSVEQLRKDMNERMSEIKADMKENIDGIKGDLDIRIRDVWKEIKYIKGAYVEEEKHQLICGKQTLEIEKMFKSCLKETAEGIFERLRALEQSMKGCRNETDAT